MEQETGTGTGTGTATATATATGTKQEREQEQEYEQEQEQKEEEIFFESYKEVYREPEHEGRIVIYHGSILQFPLALHQRLHKYCFHWERPVCEVLASANLPRPPPSAGPPPSHPPLICTS